ncbi:malate synthase A [Marivirga sp.]|uniref:malate synthase A n=1 Tax=Marivirga sp. TaxID=2018662 RepID=UPI002D802513|nr:malate synthase A [Marivirga sp.]HET8860854.1 malate synthase A [Marivirga sp.]
METTSEKVRKKNKKEESFNLLTEEAIAFLNKLHERFNEKRFELLGRREQVYDQIRQGKELDFPKTTEDIRNDLDWRIGSLPKDLQNRQVEITGPVDRKMIINALNSGAKVFMADFEDATSPTWKNITEGQQNLYDAIRKQIDFTADNGKSYKLNNETAVLKVRPRGWHLSEKNFLVNGEQISASLFDFGLYFFHNAHELIRNGSGPYFYLPKLEHRCEARLWNEVFVFAQNELGIPIGTIKSTVLIETITAAFQMEEIIYELRDHMAGLNAGRWDYIFSFIKKFRDRSDFILPDRNQVTMQVPFMKAYSNLLVKTCHRRGTHAIGGMSAFIPTKFEEENLKIFDKVRNDKTEEALAGYDGSWVAHPALIPAVKAVFEQIIGDKPHQKQVLRKEFDTCPSALTSPNVMYGEVTEKGVRMNINVALLYMESWLQGTGAVAINNLMEDAATAEISRAQLWQWYHHQVSFKNGKIFNRALFCLFLEEETQKIKEILDHERVETGKLAIARDLLKNLVKSEDFEDFFTLKAYPYL